MEPLIVVEESRLDQFLVKLGGFPSRAQVQEAIEDERVSVNGVVTTKIAQRLKAGDAVAVADASPRSSDIDPVDLGLVVLYEDDDYFVLDKPAGIAVHPGAGMEEGEHTILHGIAYLFRERGFPFSDDAVLAHRLDRETTGCLLVAKHAEAHRRAQKQFESRTVRKFYLTLVAGIPQPPEAVIDAPVGRSGTHRTKMSVLSATRSRDARTTYRTLSTADNVALLQCELHTGRTHQIRVHLRTVGHPILGDPTYASSTSEQLAARFGITDLCLHAWELTFAGQDGKSVTVRAPLPASLKHSIAEAGLEYVES